MTDDLADRGAQDRSHISLKEDHEVRHWTRALGATKEQLEEAVRAVGSSVDKVQEHLRQRR